MRLTVAEAAERGLTPLEVYDAYGDVVRRAVKSFDTATGEVVSLRLDTNGKPVTVCGELLTRTELYPAPLRFKRISPLQATLSQRQYLDMRGL